MSQKYNGTEIAIIGMSGQFPGAGSIDEFWENLKNGVESIHFMSDEDLLAEGESKENIHHPNYVNANAFIDDKQYFDADFFGYRPSEAKLLDPQIRLFHENCWKAIEDAGLDVTNDLGKIGLFAGGSQNLNWENYCLIANQNNEVDNYTASQLRNISFLCSRTSYLLNLKGPSIYLNTACSTSLIAIQKACTSLLLSECNMALAGGVSIRNSSKKGYFFQEGMIASSDGHCRPFDADSTGTIGGEGVGVVLLKKLSDALKDKDIIHAVIKGYGANNDGNEKISYTAPSIDGESNAILKAIKMARVEPESITYIEAHGTGTKMGDPIEIEALKRVFGKSEKHCFIGALKANVGHLNEASGVCAVIKTVMALKNKQIPPNINFRKLNPAIDFTNTPFRINTNLEEWKNDYYPLRAGISSFGIGGTNAHIILEEAPKNDMVSTDEGCFILKVSAKTPEALKRNAENIANKLLIEDCSYSIQDIAYTLDKGRSAFSFRQTVVASNKDEAAALLKTLNAKDSSKVLNGKRKVVFMFPGQGTQYVNMGLQLYSTEIVFKEELDTCFRIANDEFGIDLKSIVFTSVDNTETSAINLTVNTQPILFCYEYALAKTLMSSGIKPDCMIGHSIGEYVAATLSGVFDLKEAIGLVIKRGELIQRMENGLMLAVPLPESGILNYVTGNPLLSIAALNHKNSTVVSGTIDAIQKLQDQLVDDGIESRKLITSHAFHSFMMDGILDEFKQELQKTTFRPITIPFYTNLTGTLATEELVCNSDYWVKQLRETVRFNDGVKALLSNENSVFIECGPGKTLSSFVRSNEKYSTEAACVHLLRHPSELKDDQMIFLEALGKLWSLGMSYNLSTRYNSTSTRRVQLPVYSFEREEFPVIVDAFKLLSKLETPGIIGKKHPNSWYYKPTWLYDPQEFTINIPVSEKTLVVFSPTSSILMNVYEQLRFTYSKLIVVRLGADFKQLSENEFELNTNDEEQCVEFVRFINQTGYNVNTVVYDQTESSNDCFLATNIQGTILNTLKAFQQIDPKTQRGYILISQERKDKSIKNQLFGLSVCSALLKVATQEYPGVSASSISIDLDSVHDEAFLNQFANELCFAQTGREVLLKNGERWEKSYKKINIKQKGQSPLFDDGVYLLTGGLGKLNTFITNTLLENGSCKVAIIGRSSNELIEDSSNVNQLDDEKRNRLSQLQKYTNRFLYLTADSTKESEVRSAVQKIEQKWGEVTGVFHTAGLTVGQSFQTLEKLSMKEILAQNAPKLEGMMVLEKIFGNKDLQFCLSTSSLSSILGGINFAAYSNANMLMENYLQFQRLSGKLPNWTIACLDGLNFDNDRGDGIDLSSLWEVITTCIEHRSNPLTIVSTTDLQQRIDQWVFQNYDENQGDLLDESLFIDDLNEESDMSFTEQRLIQLWKHFFGRSSLTVEDDFFELGGDSLQALTMIGSIYKHLNIQITITDFFNRSTVKSIAEYIDMQNWLKENAVAEKNSKTEIIL